MANGVAAETEIEFAELLQTLQAPSDGRVSIVPKKPRSHFLKNILSRTKTWFLVKRVSTVGAAI